MIRTALRSLLKTPLFTSLVVATLALGIGANTATFSVWKAIAFDPLPYGDPDRLVTIAESDSHNPNPESVANGTRYEFQTRSESFDQLSLWGDGILWPVRQGHTDLWRGMQVNASFFDVLGTEMMLGHNFAPDDDQPNTADKVILSYSLWMSYFGGDRRIVGKTIQMSGNSSYTVIGVLGPDFHPLHMSNPGEIPSFYIPLGMDAHERMCHSCRGIRMIGKLRRGVTVAQARAEVNGIMRQLAVEYPDDYAPDAGVQMMPMQEKLVGRFDEALTLVLGSVGLLLLLGASNVANLMMARATGKQSELAVRAALGAGRGTLARQMLTESLLLSLMGGAMGVACAYGITRLLSIYGATEIPRVDETAPSIWLLVWGLAVSLTTGLLFGIAPALVAARMDLRSILSGSTTSSLGRRKHRFLHGLVTIEIALAFVLVLGVGLLGQSYWRLMQVDLGVDPRNVMTASLLPHGADTPEKVIASYERVLSEMRKITGVTDVGYASTLPLSHPQAKRFYVNGRVPAEKMAAPQMNVYRVSPGYLRAMKIRLLRGRLIDEGDRRGGNLVALVSDLCARTQFGGTDPIGQRVKTDDWDDQQPWVTVVGVVADVRQYGLDEAPDPGVYLPFVQMERPQDWASLVVRTEKPVAGIGDAMRKALYAADPSMPVFHMQPMNDYIAKSIAQRSFVFGLVSVFGFLALALATVGIYGVVAYTVGLRTREVGIRMAIGADRRDVYWLILREVLLTATIGLGIGLAVALWAAQFWESLLFGVKATDGVTIAAIAALLLVVALLAAFVPARRAARILPVHALRD